jgi:uncharacterized protein (DUF433 family)
MIPREVPAYTIAEAARYLRLPQSTLGHWVRGHKTFKPILTTPNGGPILSFVNLVEAHVLWAITRQHQIKLPNVREAVDYLKVRVNEPHPLAAIDLEHDGVDIVVRILGDIINATRKGQVAMKEIVEASLRRIQRGPDGKTPVALYPFITDDISMDRKSVMFNPEIAFGRLVIVDSGVPTTEVAQRYKAGESMDELADDYGLLRNDIEDAVRCELHVATAA